MKRVLIISPYFPPTNAADMQRIRMSLPYLKDNNWEAEIVVVDEKHSDLIKDEFLCQSIPPEIRIHKVNAFSKIWTRKIGLGSIALRSLWFYLRKVNQLLGKQKFDLIYFSTTQFPVMILGAYWKKKFNVPFVIDMQDPWHSDYYQDKPKAERPSKYWLSYRLNKFLEPIAMNSVDGLISVSSAYLETLKERYPRVNTLPQKVITFGAFQLDFEFVKENSQKFSLHHPIKKDCINFVYVGRGGYDMKPALVLLFEAFKKGLKMNAERFSKIRFHFIGTSYAPKGKGLKTIKPIADEMGLSAYVNEDTDRIPFYQGLFTLMKSDVLLIIGSEDAKYTASKIYPYILAERPLLALFHPESSAGKIITECNAGYVISLNVQKEKTIDTIYDYLTQALNDNTIPQTDWINFEKYSAKKMVKQQVSIFNEVINK